MKHLAKQEEETSNLLAVITRAAADPAVDLAKMERLLEMQERILAKRNEALFHEAMTAAQAQMSMVSTDAINPQTRSRYASYSQLDKALRPIYTKHGFSLSFDTGDSPKPDFTRVLCYVSHNAGHSRTYHKDEPADGKGAKGGDVMTKTHAGGAAITYGMRYLLKMIFNVAVGEDDTDGNVPLEPVSEDQALTLDTLIKDTKSDKVKFLRYISHRMGSEINTIREIPRSQFEAAVQLLQKKQKKRDDSATKP